MHRYLKLPGIATEPFNARGFWIVKKKINLLHYPRPLDPSLGARFKRLSLAFAAGIQERRIAGCPYFSLPVFSSLVPALVFDPSVGHACRPFCPLESQFLHGME
jgi:hypothetical protein